ncbi:hypothetical protein [Streptomyces sp. NPDC059651]|uniref:hypothetical protein n=1 Tax=Streptomyces sp. NPDC059651 TaxID=3346897 RepID=UPI00367D8DB6
MKLRSGTTDVATGEVDDVAKEVMSDQPASGGAEKAGPPGTAESAGDDDTDSGAGRTTGDDREDGPGRRWPRVVAGVLAAVLVLAGGAFYVAGRQLRDTPATDNRALTDSMATTQVAGDVTNALGKVFSYGPADIAATKASAQRLLAGKALQQYAALFGQVEKQAADQKLTLTTHVVRAGVIRLTDDSAQLLVFLDQVYERKGKAASTAAAQLSVTARLREGRWTIVDIKSR